MDSLKGILLKDTELRNKEIKLNLVIYALFLIIAFSGILYGNTIKDNHSFLRIWDGQNIALLLLGIPFLFLQDKVNIPNFWTANISNKQRLILPAFIGSIFGILDVVVLKMLIHPEHYSELPPFLQPFPYSCFLYFSGAVEIEVFYRLVPLTLILLMSNWYADGKYFNRFFWIGVVITSLREPLEQMPEGTILLILYSLLTGFLMNFLQAIYYKKFGFLATLAIRLGHYLFWHILLGIYVQYFELL